MQELARLLVDLLGSFEERLRLVIASKESVEFGQIVEAGCYFHMIRTIFVRSQLQRFLCERQRIFIVLLGVEVGELLVRTDQLW